MTQEIVDKAFAHAIASVLFMPVNVALLMLLGKIGVLQFFDLPQVTWRQAFGLAIVVSFLS